jgi:hypothetical protein
MGGQPHFYGLNHLHYLTTSAYRRARFCDRRLESPNADIPKRCLRHPPRVFSSICQALGQGFGVHFSLDITVMYSIVHMGACSPLASGGL